jgi:hypothetical protein
MKQAYYNNWRTSFQIKDSHCEIKRKENPSNTNAKRDETMASNQNNLLSLRGWQKWEKISLR